MTILSSVTWISIILRYLRTGKLLSLVYTKDLRSNLSLELEFHHLNNVSKAEKSRKVIASALQSALGCNVEIRFGINNSDSGHGCNHSKVKTLEMREIKYHNVNESKNL
ncbi:hypothetical protein L2E82_39433 [Cichorium intybus]|uniref:Uncharacterized protein n=1 Tax=Cichorium intybus TaxID=13427 RepID=A0ACB9AHP7_CICIN|nr:hypothetical protein L2E82_39433 [Cichorium intybus]